MFDDRAHTELESERRELVGLLCEALDQYDAGDADVSALVHDVDSVIIELTLCSDPTWIMNLRNQWRALACVLVDGDRAGTSSLSMSELDRVAEATKGLRFLASQPVLVE